MGAWFSLVGRSSSKTSHSFFEFKWLGLNGERLFALPTWIMKNTVNLIQLSKYIFNSAYEKSIGVRIRARSRDLPCGGHLLLLTSTRPPLYGSGGIGSISKSRDGSFLASGGQHITSPKPQCWSQSGHIPHELKQTCYLGLLRK